VLPGIDCQEFLRWNFPAGNGSNPDLFARYSDPAPVSSLPDVLLS
jgi:hypothetical protein